MELNISLIYNFSTTINLFCDYIINLYQRYSINTQIKKYSSFTAGYFIISYFFDDIYKLNLLVLFSLYWIIIGSLSTIGFGFGLQTGVLFLSPYIINNYNSILEIYNTTHDQINNSNKVNNIFLLCYIKCLSVVILWGIGTALGELPPFLLAKHYNETKQNTELTEIDENEMNDTIRLIKTYKNNKIFKKLTSCLKKYRVVSIILFSSWPNITFDMCGLMCGYYNFEVCQFLIPTIIGKSLIKAPAQAFMVLYIYSHNIDYDNSEYSKRYTILYLWYLIQYFLILYFIKSSIETIAKLQYKKIINYKNK